MFSLLSNVSYSTQICKNDGNAATVVFLLAMTIQRKLMSAENHAPSTKMQDKHKDVCRFNWENQETIFSC